MDYRRLQESAATQPASALSSGTASRNRAGRAFAVAPGDSPLRSDTHVLLRQLWNPNPNSASEGRLRITGPTRETADYATV
jgi:hypothetical protein